MPYFLYQEDNLENRNDRPREDFCLNGENIFVVADGITHDLVVGAYPSPSEAYLVAKIASKEIFNHLKNNFCGLEDIKEAYGLANKKIADFQRKSNLYQNREINNYTIGAAVIAAAIIKGNKLYYGVLDDCAVAVFGENGIDRLKLIPFVEKSAKYLFKKYSWQNPEGRKFWRKNLRNHILKFGDKSYGYGALDGRSGYKNYLQTGAIELKNGDLVCIYSDGFIKPLQDKKFIEKIKMMEDKNMDLDWIKKYLRSKKIVKEKTCYFIKI